MTNSTITEDLNGLERLESLGNIITAGETFGYDASIMMLARNMGLVPAAGEHLVSFENLSMEADGDAVKAEAHAQAGVSMSHAEAKYQHTLDSLNHSRDSVAEAAKGVDGEIQIPTKRIALLLATLHAGTKLVRQLGNSKNTVSMVHEFINEHKGALASEIGGAAATRGVPAHEAVSMVDGMVSELERVMKSPKALTAVRAASVALFVANLAIYFLIYWLATAIVAKIAKIVIKALNARKHSGGDEHGA